MAALAACRCVLPATVAVQDKTRLHNRELAMPRILNAGKGPRDPQQVGVLRNLAQGLRCGTIPLGELAAFVTDHTPVVADQARTVLVNYDDARWRSIDHSRYAYVHPHVGIGLLPICGKGHAKRTFHLLRFRRELSTLEVLTTIEGMGFRCPDRAEVESYIDTVPGGTSRYYDPPIIALCGSVEGDHRGLGIWSLYLTHLGRAFGFHKLESLCPHGCWFVSVRD